MLVLDTGLVGLEAFHCNAPLLVAKKLSCDWRIRTQDDNNNTPSDAEGANDKEFVFPAV